MRACAEASVTSPAPSMRSTTPSTISSSRPLLVRRLVVPAVHPRCDPRDNEGEIAKRDQPVRSGSRRRSGEEIRSDDSLQRHGSQRRGRAGQRCLRRAPCPPRFEGQRRKHQRRRRRRPAGGSHDNGQRQRCRASSAANPATRVLPVIATSNAMRKAAPKIAQMPASIAGMPISGGKRMAAGAAIRNGAASTTPMKRLWRRRSAGSPTELWTRRSQRAAMASSSSPVLVPDRRTQRTRTSTALARFAGRLCLSSKFAPSL